MRIQDSTDPDVNSDDTTKKETQLNEQKRKPDCKNTYVLVIVVFSIIAICNVYILSELTQITHIYFTYSDLA